MADIVALFVADKIDKTDNEGVLSTKELYGAFVEYCQQSKLTVINDVNFFKRLREEIPDIVKEHIRDGNKRVWVYRGLSFIDETKTTREPELIDEYYVTEEHTQLIEPADSKCVEIEPEIENDDIDVI